MDKNEKFEVVYMFQDPMDGHMDGDYLGDIDVEGLLEDYPEISESQLEEIKKDGEGTIILNYITGDMLKLTYIGEEQ